MTVVTDYRPSLEFEYACDMVQFPSDSYNELISSYRLATLSWSRLKIVMVHWHDWVPFEVVVEQDYTLPLRWSSAVELRSRYFWLTVRVKSAHH